MNFHLDNIFHIYIISKFQSTRFMKWKQNTVEINVCIPTDINIQQVLNIVPHHTVSSDLSLPLLSPLCPATPPAPPQATPSQSVSMSMEMESRASRQVAVTSPSTATTTLAWGDSAWHRTCYSSVKLDHVIP